ncbi:MAG: hypothetical protein V3R93_08090 [Candidatus Hydrothermarchaeaceae archaeon]
MPKCDICGATVKERYKCQACGKKFCDDCGDPIDERCESCLTEDEW